MKASSWLVTTLTGLTGSVISLSAPVALAETTAAQRAQHWCGADHVDWRPIVAENAAAATADQVRSKPSKPFGPSISADAEPAQFTAAPRIVWLNRNGGTYKQGTATNSATSSLNPRIIPRSNFTIRPLPTAFDWTKIVTCVKNHFKPFNVRFVETRPESGKYIEAVVGGDGSEVGFGSGGGLLGIAAADNFCGLTEAGIAFSFAEAHTGFGRANDELCSTVAHEIGHLIAQEHIVLSSDIMSYVPTSRVPMKGFQNQLSRCGTDSGNLVDCTCPTDTNQQNTFMRMLTVLGTKPTETVPPTITIDSPENNSDQGPSIKVTATAKDNTGVDIVTLYVDGQERGNDSTPTDNKFEITVRGLSEGPHSLLVQAEDASGNKAMAEVKVMVARQELGGYCVDNSDCLDALCAFDGVTNFCTKPCDINNGSSCPDDFACIASGDGKQNLCVFSGDDGGGVCGCQSDRGGAAALVTLLVGMVVTSGRRRKRPTT